MSSKPNHPDPRALICRDFELTGMEDSLEEQAFIDQLADQVADMLEHRPEYLFSLLYRIDVLEPVVQACLAPDNPLPGNVALARAIWDRQRQRAWTKQHYNQPDIDLDGEDW